MSKIVRQYNMLNTSQYVALQEEELRNDGLPADINSAPDLVTWDTTLYTNCQKEMWGGVGQLTDAQASVSGGDQRTAFRFGTGYIRKTIFVGSYCCIGPLYNPQGVAANADLLGNSYIAEPQPEYNTYLENFSYIWSLACIHCHLGEFAILDEIFLFLGYSQ